MIGPEGMIFNPERSPRGVSAAHTVPYATGRFLDHSRQITRGPHVVGFARGARITMDGADIANVGVGKTVTLEVPPGKHVLNAWLGGNPSAQNTIVLATGERP